MPVLLISESKHVARSRVLSQILHAPTLVAGIVLPGLHELEPKKAHFHGQIAHPSFRVCCNRSDHCSCTADSSSEHTGHSTDNSGSARSWDACAY